MPRLGVQRKTKRAFDYEGTAAPPPYQEAAEAWASHSGTTAQGRTRRGPTKEVGRENAAARERQKRAVDFVRRETDRVEEELAMEAQRARRAGGTDSDSAVAKSALAVYSTRRLRGPPREEEEEAAVAAAAEEASSKQEQSWQDGEERTTLRWAREPYSSESDEEDRWREILAQRRQARQIARDEDGVVGPVATPEDDSSETMRARTTQGPGRGSTGEAVSLQEENSRLRRELESTRREAAASLRASHAELDEVKAVLRTRGVAEAKEEQPGQDDEVKAHRSARGPTGAEEGAAWGEAAAAREDCSVFAAHEANVARALRRRRGDALDDLRAALDGATARDGFARARDIYAAFQVARLAPKLVSPDDVRALCLGLGMDATGRVDAIELLEVLRDFAAMEIADEPRDDRDTAHFARQRDGPRPAEYDLVPPTLFHAADVRLQGRDDLAGTLGRFVLDEVGTLVARDEDRGHYYGTSRQDEEDEDDYFDPARPSPRRPQRRQRKHHGQPRGGLVDRRPASPRRRLSKDEGALYDDEDSFDADRDAYEAAKSRTTRRTVPVRQEARVVLDKRELALRAAPRHHHHHHHHHERYAGSVLTSREAEAILAGLRRDFGEFAPLEALVRAVPGRCAAAVRDVYERMVRETAHDKADPKKDHVALLAAALRKALRAEDYQGTARGDIAGNNCVVDVHRIGDREPWLFEGSRAAFRDVAQRLCEATKRDADALFDLVDADADGKLNRRELLLYLRDVDGGWTRQTLRARQRAQHGTVRTNAEQTVHLESLVRALVSDESGQPPRRRTRRVPLAASNQQDPAGPPRRRQGAARKAARALARALATESTDAKLALKELAKTLAHHEARRGAVTWRELYRALDHRRLTQALSRLDLDALREEFKEEAGDDDDIMGRPKKKKNPVVEWRTLISLVEQARSDEDAEADHRLSSDGLRALLMRSHPRARALKLAAACFQACDVQDGRVSYAHVRDFLRRHAQLAV